MTPRDEFVSLGGLGFHYRDWGGSGPPVVLLHGLASNARIWDLTAPLLARRFRVLAPDQRGHGLTDKPDEGYDFAAMAGDVAAFAEALGLERPGLVGHSWGGNVGLQLAADRPQSVAWLALVDGGFLEVSAFPEMTWERAQEMMSPPPLAGLKLDVFLEGARRWPGLGGVWSEQVRDIVLANFHVDQEGAIHPRLSRDNHLKILRALWEQKPSLLWERLSCPALLVAAAREHDDPRNVVWMQEKRKAITLAQERATAVQVVWMEDTIHDVPLQRPGELADAIERFVDSTG